jgi:hypothetical protein
VNARADGSRYLVAAVGLRRQRQLAVMLSMVEIPRRAWVLELGTDADLGYLALLLARPAAVDRPAATQLPHRPLAVARRAVPRDRVAEPLRLASPCLADPVHPRRQHRDAAGSWLCQATPVPAVTVDDQHRPTEPLMLVEADPHPHHTGYDATHDVDLNLDSGGYSVTACLAANTCA